MQNQRGKVVLFFDGIADMPRYRYPVQKSTELVTAFRKVGSDLDR